eukprot:TRINITY_DN6757_c0_g1_i2.p1 TRINITY_DN6757_c0_g1~~TRINITY_DN6757_c0_g1_i2.p1  ORF type:complete len:2398 (+),score=351.14 TRINITY_DN6757_c0_g1_i2:352-7545(+)
MFLRCLSEAQLLLPTPSGYDRIEEWTTDEVCAWLTATCVLEPVCEIVRAEDICGASLSEITEDDLEQFGLSFGLRKAFWKLLCFLLSGRFSVVAPGELAQPDAAAPPLPLTADSVTEARSFGLQPSPVDGEVQRGQLLPEPASKPVKLSSPVVPLLNLPLPRSEASTPLLAAEAAPALQEKLPASNLAGPAPSVASEQGELRVKVPQFEIPLPLIQLTYGEQDDALADTCKLNIETVTQLCNGFIAQSADAAKLQIDFAALNSVSVPIVALYGNKQEILRFLSVNHALGPKGRASFQSDTKPGIYLSSNTAQLFAFLWHERAESFAKAERRDITCNMLRFLLEISSSVICVMSDAETKSLVFTGASDVVEERITPISIRRETSQADSLKLHPGFVFKPRPFSRLGDGLSKQAILEPSLVKESVGWPDAPVVERDMTKAKLAHEVANMCTHYNVNIEKLTDMKSLIAFLQASVFSSEAEILIRTSDEAMQKACNERERVRAAESKINSTVEAVLKYLLMDNFPKLEDFLDGILCLMCLNSFKSGEKLLKCHCSRFVHAACVKLPMKRCDKGCDESNFGETYDGDMEKLFNNIEERQKSFTIGSGVPRALVDRACQSQLAAFRDSFVALQHLRLLLNIAKVPQKDRPYELRCSNPIAQYRRLLTKSAATTNPLLAAISQALGNKTEKELEAEIALRYHDMEKFPARNEICKAFIGTCRDLREAFLKATRVTLRRELMKEILPAQAFDSDVYDAIRVIHGTVASRTPTAARNSASEPSLQLRVDSLTEFGSRFNMVVHTQYVTPAYVRYSLNTFMFRKDAQAEIEVDSLHVASPTLDDNQIKFEASTQDSLLAVYPLNSSRALYVVTGAKHANLHVTDVARCLKSIPHLVTLSSFEEQQGLLALYCPYSHQVNGPLVVVYQFNKASGRPSFTTVVELNISDFEDIQEVHHLEFIRGTMLLALVNTDDSIHTIDLHPPVKKDLRKRPFKVPSRILKVSSTPDGYYALLFSDNQPPPPPPKPLPPTPRPAVLPVATPRRSPHPAAVTASAEDKYASPRVSLIDLEFSAEGAQAPSPTQPAGPATDSSVDIISLPQSDPSIADKEEAVELPTCPPPPTPRPLRMVMHVFKMSELRSSVPVVSIELDDIFDAKHPETIHIGQVGPQLHLLTFKDNIVHSRIIESSTEQSQLRLRSKRAPARAQTKSESVAWNGYMDHYTHIFDKFCVSSALELASGTAKRWNLKGCFVLNTTQNVIDDLGLRTAIPNYMSQILTDVAVRTKKPFEQLTWNWNVQTADTSTLSPDTRKLGDWLRHLICVVPLQIARASGGEFRPLSNGKRIALADLALDVAEFAERIHFGLYDAVLRESTKPIRVVTSMGKQSTGKSYMLNHLTGALFDIAGGRCTDGIWLTLRETPSHLYVVLDFEGLGSIERNEQEDTLLSVFNAAISGATLYKIENRIDKDMQSTMQRFQKGVSLIKGDDKLFRGTLNIVVKDVVSRSDVEELNDEICSKIQAVASDSPAEEDFLTMMYGGELVVMCFPCPGNVQFYQQMSRVAQSIEDMPPSHFTESQMWRRTTRLLMAKITFRDWTSLDRSYIMIRVGQLRQQISAAVCRGCARFGVSVDECPLNNISSEQLIECPPVAELDEINAYQDAGLDLLASLESGSESQQAILVASLISWYMKNVKDRTADNRLDWQEGLQITLNAIVTRRIARVTRWFEVNSREFASDTTMMQLQRELETRLTMLRQAWQLCDVKCDSCFFRCVRAKGTHKQHDCDGSHQCESECDYCLESGEGCACRDLAGHDGTHDCKVKPHTCGADCSLKSHNNCNHVCSQKSNHNDAHLCNSTVHYCSAPCALPGCQNTCTLPHNMQHDRHSCHEVACPQPCPIKGCNRTCQAKNHFHGVDTTDEHFCGHEHQCAEDCEESGICDLVTELRAERQMFEGARGKFEYQCYTSMNGRRLTCCKKIPPNTMWHTGPHVHSEREDVVHYCQTRCKACGYYCNMPHGHSQVLHRPSHGNMRHTFWASESNDIDIGARRYVAGEPGQAEMCNMFCKSMGRGHIHIDSCACLPDQLQTPDIATLATGRRHAAIKYQPDPDVPKDEMTHKYYWEHYLQFQDPAPSSEAQLYEMCPYECTHGSHQQSTGANAAAAESDDEEDKHSFCVLPLWHDDAASPLDGSNVVVKGHEFACKHASSQYHIIFCMDFSGSMSGTDHRPSLARIARTHNNRLGAVYNAAHSFIQTRLAASATDVVSMVLFDNTAAVAFQHQQLSTTLLDIMLQYTPQGSTNFSAGLDMCDQVLLHYGQEKYTPIVIFLSDGGDCSSDRQLSVQRLMQNHGSRGLTIHCIAFGGGADARTLHEVSSLGNGQTHTCSDTILLNATMDGIADACARNQFSLRAADRSRES